MNRDLQLLQDLQGLDTRLEGLERRLDAMPGRIQSVRDEFGRAKSAFETIRATLDRVRKDLRTKEKELEYQGTQRGKLDAKLYEVKTNKEYSAVLSEIETLKVEKGRIEEEILGLMELQERAARDIVDAEARLKVEEAESRRLEGEITAELKTLQADRDAVRTDRESVARDLPRDVLAQYARLLKGRGGLAVAVVGPAGICGGCRVTLTPHRLMQVRSSNEIMTCESCGRIFYYQA
jgi:predicted  nucleic acid-binding Zn-ribbon protein